MNELDRKRAGSDVVATSHDTIFRPKSKVKSKENHSDTSERPSLNVPQEEEDRIIPRAGGRLVVPREEIEDDYSAGEELDLNHDSPLKTRKPGRREWIRLYRKQQLQTKLLILKPNPDMIDPEYYWVDHKLRKNGSSD